MFDGPVEGGRAVAAVEAGVEVVAAPEDVFSGSRGAGVTD